MMGNLKGDSFAKFESSTTHKNKTGSRVLFGLILSVHLILLVSTYFFAIASTSLNTLKKLPPHTLIISSSE